MKVIAQVRSVIDLDKDQIEEQLIQLSKYAERNNLDIEIIHTDKVAQTGRVKKANAKGFAGGRVPYGYNLIDGDTLVIDPEEAKVVKEIYKLRKEGISFQKLANTINSNKDNVRVWSKQAISYLIKNPIYNGVYKYDGDKENNDISFKVPHIISKRLWNEVNK